MSERRDYIEAPPVPADFPLPRWVISDTHFGHARIAGYTGRPDDWEERILTSWMDSVGEDDTLLHLGDLYLCARSRMEELAEILPGRKWMVPGNHDTRSRGSYTQMGFPLIAPPVWQVDGWTITCTHVPREELVRYPRHLNVHGHIHNHLEENPRFLNVSVEQTNYGPVEFLPLLRERIALLESRR